MRRDRRGSIFTEFRVKWECRDGKAEFSWEPMSSITTVPLLLEELENKSRQDHIKRLGPVASNALVSKGIGNFPQIPASFLSTFKHPAEFIPNGNEIVRNISNEVVDNGVKLWSTTFIGMEGFYFVRKCVMEYYFPVDAALFAEIQCNNEKLMKAQIEK
jgi:hypothetical protein